MFQEQTAGRTLNFDSDDEGDASPETYSQHMSIPDGNPPTTGREVALRSHSGVVAKQGPNFGSPLYTGATQLASHTQSGFSGNSQNTQGTGYSGSIGDGSSTYRTDQESSQFLDKQQLGSGDRNPDFGPRSIFSSGGGDGSVEFHRGGSSDREGSRISVEDDAVPFANFDSPDSAHRSPAAGFDAVGGETPERRMNRPRGAGVGGRFFEQEQHNGMFQDMETDNQVANGWYDDGTPAKTQNERQPQLDINPAEGEVEEEDPRDIASPLGGPQAGKLIFDYSNHKDIGAGDFGSVVAATYDEDGVRYAIKTSKKKVTGERELQSRLQEVYALSAISSPYLLRYYEAWIENGLVSIKTEYLPDGSVKKLPTPWSEENLWFLLLQVSLGLHALHSANIAHLDVKPDNIFVDLQKQQQQHLPEGGNDECRNTGTYPVYKLGDFGLARPVKDNSPVGEHFDGLNEDEGDCRYLCPALLKQTGTINMHLTEADVYSLGASVVDLAGGDPVRLRNEGTTSFPVNYSHQLQDFLLRMLNPEPTMRPTAFQCVEQSTRAVASLLGGGEGGKPLLPEFEMLNDPQVTVVASHYQGELSSLDEEYQALLQEYEALQQEEDQSHQNTFVVAE